jgi:hypothetical protein
MSSSLGSVFRWKPTLFELAILAACVGVWIALLLPGPDFDRTYRYPPVLLDGGSDLSEIAGQYFRGGKYGGDNLSILADSRYSFFRAYCTGVFNRESGHVKIVDGNHVLKPVESPEFKALRVLLAIRWQSRRYLIAPDTMQEFCDDIIEGNEPQDEGRGHFYLRGPAVPVDGVPELPEKWATYLREKLVIGRIVEVMEGGHARLDLGSADGIEKGDILTVQGGDRFRHRYVRVESIQERSSVGVDPQWQPSQPPLPAGRCVVMQRDIRKPTTRR